jgi:hypothetical protein
MKENEDDSTTIYLYINIRRGIGNPTSKAILHDIRWHSSFNQNPPWTLI